MFDAIRGATSTIDFLTFVYWVGDIGREFAEPLAERAEAGVASPTNGGATPATPRSGGTPTSRCRNRRSAVYEPPSCL